MRAILGWLTVAVAVVAVALLASASPGSSQAQEDATRGGALYAQNCVGCHGPQGEGGSGPGVLDAPPIDDVEVAYVDLVIRTGRMPIVEPRAGVSRRPDLTATDRRLLVSWIADEFDLDGEVPEVPDGDAPRGRVLFNEHCATCHSTTGYGGIAGAGETVRSVRGLDPVAIHEATRVGPFGMPAFSETILSDEEVADIAAAIEEMDAEPPSPLTITDVTHVTGTVYALLTVAALVLLVVAVARLPRITVHEEESATIDEPEPEEGPPR